MHISVIAVILQLIFLEGILSIDNAAVLGAMASRLPDHRMVPWPRLLRFMRRPGRTLLGNQRSAALRVGLLGAYAGRGAMLFFAGLVIAHPWIRVVGAAYLLFLVVRHFAEEFCAGSGEGHEEPRAARRKSRGFWRTVLSIELADLAFSVDNVVAAVALSPAYWVTVIGVGIGIIVMRFAAGVFARMIRWEPALANGAYILIAAVGVELVLESAAGIYLTEMEQFAISAAIVGGTLLVARTSLRARINRRTAFFPKACAAICGFFRGIAGSLRGRRPGSPSSPPGRTAPRGSSSAGA
ncbi:MAG: hypothetical protein QUS11_04045 [Candidatus Fermentibacter sp.]|nr:hypothetical protein [Candidatus Fermentibacter sp.]